MTSKRSRAREAALQLLFQHDLNPNIPREEVLRFAREQLADDELEAFALSLYDRVLAGRDGIDARIAAAAENWRLARMAVIDRNVLRLGAGELLLHDGGDGDHTPPGVVFNEVIELARRFGSADSPGFVNGVLDRLLKEWQREQAPPPPETPPPTPSA